MTQLAHLNVHHNAFSDATPFAQFTTLEHLNLQGNQLTDISPLAALTNLTELYIHENQVTNVSSLAALIGLEYLTVRDNLVTTGVASLVTLVAARTINLEGNDQIPCCDLDALEAALGPGIVTRPANCT